jgi:hypothetical protein
MPFCLHVNYPSIWWLPLHSNSLKCTSSTPAPTPRLRVADGSSARLVTPIACVVHADPMEVGVLGNSGRQHSGYHGCWDVHSSYQWLNHIWNMYACMFHACMHVYIQTCKMYMCILYIHIIIYIHSYVYIYIVHIYGISTLMWIIDNCTRTNTGMHSQVLGDRHLEKRSVHGWHMFPRISVISIE